MPFTWKICIDLGSGIPAYRQVADAFRARLVGGELKAGDHLPPIRGLAIELGVHFNTIAEGYRVLASEGWIELKRRRGALVLDRPRPARPRAGATGDFSRRLREFIASVRSEGLPAATVARELRQMAESMEPEGLKQ